MLNQRLRVTILLAAAMISACDGGEARVADSVEATSLLGQPLVSHTPDPDARRSLEANLAAAVESLRANPHSADALIWVGRRLAYLGRYREAIDTFGVGVDLFPQDARFLRHRGHRWLTIRKPNEAVADFTRASELIAGSPDAIEPDGAPNARNIPLSTNHFNIWYHLGLAHYVNGNFEMALQAYDSCMNVSVNPDLKVATSYWRYLTLKRLGRTAASDSVLVIAKENPELIENTSYLKLLRLFAGLESIEIVQPSANATATIADATTAYGVSMWHFLNGRESEARAMWTRITASPSWASFGVLAAEAELVRNPASDSTTASGQATR
jgi:tetratricopeptide (TPR) repeat protein